MGFVLAFLAAAVLSPFGLYHHVPATDLEQAPLRAELSSAFNLVTVRGDGGSTAGGVGAFLEGRGNAAAYLYRRGTAVSEDDAATFEREHADWLARDAQGRVVTSNAGGTVIDITNPAVRAWLVGGVKRDAANGAYDGVYLDVLGAFFSARFYSARPVVAGAPLADTAWRDACVALVREVKAATGKPVVANGFGLQNGKNYADHKADADLLIAAADGIQIEQFVRNGNQGLDVYKPAARWREDVDFLRDVGRLGKIVLADTRVRESGDAADVARQRTYALASFLVGAEGPARFRFAEGAATGTVDASMAETINALGAPEGAARAEGDALVRRFEAGTVSVDPVAHTARIDVAGTAGVATGPEEGGTGRRPLVVGAAVAVLVFLLGLFLLARSRRD